MRSKRTIYYTNELEDEFSKGGITAKTIGDDYVYDLGRGKRVLRFIVYRIIVKSLGWLFLKVKYGHRIVNGKALREARGTGYYLYGNHTNATADPFVPSIIDFNSDTYVIVHPDNVSMPVLGKITPILGALPLPDTLKAAKNLNKTLKAYREKGAAVMIYPEAHIWPYYTGIRPFKADSFGYPVNFDAPVYCFTNVYKKRRFHYFPRLVTYVDGPFTWDKSIPKNKQREDLRNQVYSAMLDRSRLSDVQMIDYVKVEKP